MISMEKTDILQKFLNINTLLDNYEDIKIAKLRKVQFKYTVEERPFLRMVLTDISGKSVIGRMFDINTNSDIGSAIENLIGEFVYVEFYTQKSPVEYGITVKSVKSVSAEYSKELSDALADSYTYRFNNSWDSFNNTLKAAGLELSPDKTASWSVFRTFSDESIGGGTPSAICNVLSNTVLSARCAGVSMDVLVSFIDVVAEWCKTAQQSCTLANLQQISFCASVINKVQMDGDSVKARNKMLDVSDFIALISGTSKVCSPATKLVFELYKSFSEYSTLKEQCSGIPSNGFITHNGEVIRK